MNSPSPEENSTSEMNLDEKVDRMLDAARGGLTPHDLLIQASLAEAANVDERAAAREKNRERALKLLELLEKSQG